MLTIFLLVLFFVSNKVTVADESFVRGCYFTSWSQFRTDDGRYVPENYVPGLCTHIYYAFAGLSTDFTLKSLTANEENGIISKGMYSRVVALKKLQPGLKVLLSFAGYSFSNDNAILLQFMVSSQQTRQKFINSVVNFLIDYGFDGFDVAWLFPSNKYDFTLFLRELKSSFDEHKNLLLTASVSGVPSVIRAKYDVKAVGEILDQINVISYDLHGPWERVTGHNSPLFDRNGDKLSIRDAMEAWYKGGAPKSKLVAGLAAYGHGWTLAMNDSKVGAPASGPSPPGPFTKEAGIIAYYEVCVFQGVRNYDSVQENAYVVVNDLWFSYDNRRSFETKLNWIKDNGYRGANVWALDHDDFSGNCMKGEMPKYPLISLMKDVFRQLPLPSSSVATIEFDFHNVSTILPENATWSPKIFADDANQTVTPTTPNLCTKMGVYKDPKSCTRFYACKSIGSKPILANCLFGLFFSEETKRCETPTHVKCNLI